MMPPAQWSECSNAEPNQDFTRVGSSLFHRLVLTVCVLLFAAGVTAAFVQAYDVFFLFFLSILLAVFLRGIANAVSDRTGLSPGWSLTILVILLTLLIIGGGWAVGAAAAAQLDQLIIDIPRSVEHLRERLSQSEWGRKLLQFAPSPETLKSPGGFRAAAGHLSAFFTTTLGILGNLVLVFILALFLAADPRTYLQGILRLFPHSRRRRGRQLFASIGQVLWRWLLGRGIAMIAVGFMTVAGLWFLEVKQYLVLGILAGLLVVVPYLGPILAGIPAVLVALLQDPMLAVWVLVLYLAVQAVENYLLTPLVQQSMIQLPPALVLAAVVLLGSLFGFLAMIVATPLTAVVSTSIKLLYVRDVLGEPVKVPVGEQDPVPSTQQSRQGRSTLWIFGAGLAFMGLWLTWRRQARTSSVITPVQPGVVFE